MTTPLSPSSPGPPAPPCPSPAPSFPARGGVRPAMDPTGKLLKAEDFDSEMLASLMEVAGRFAVNLLIALLILVATFWIGRFLGRAIKRGFAKAHPAGDTDTTLANFISSLVRYGVTIVGLVAVFSQL